MHCSQCGTNNEVSAKFCRSCGASVPATGGAQPSSSPLLDLPRYEPPSWAMPILGWIVYSVGVLGFVANDNGAGLLAVIASTLIVGFDAGRIGVKYLTRSSLEGLSGIDRSSTAMWVVCSLLLWIVVVPLYLIKRSKLAQAAWTTRVTKAFKPSLDI